MTLGGAATPAPREPAERLAAAVLAVPGVAALHPGMFGEVGTYLPGRRVAGIRITDNVVDVHVGHLRRKLGDNSAEPRYVTTVRGVGYRMGEG